MADSTVTKSLEQPIKPLRDLAAKALEGIEIVRVKTPAQARLLIEHWTHRVDIHDDGSDHVRFCWHFQRGLLNRRMSALELASFILHHMGPILGLLTPNPNEPPGRMRQLHWQVYTEFLALYYRLLQWPETVLAEVVPWLRTLPDAEEDSLIEMNLGAKEIQIGPSHFVLGSPVAVEEINDLVAAPAAPEHDVAGSQAQAVAASAAVKGITSSASAIAAAAISGADDLALPLWPVGSANGDRAVGVSAASDGRDLHVLSNVHGQIRHADTSIRVEGETQVAVLDLDTDLGGPIGEDLERESISKREGNDRQHAVLPFLKEPAPTSGLQAPNADAGKGGDGSIIADFSCAGEGNS